MLRSFQGCATTGRSTRSQGGAELPKVGVGCSCPPLSKPVSSNPPTKLWRRLVGASDAEPSEEAGAAGSGKNGQEWQRCMASRLRIRCVNGTPTRGVSGALVTPAPLERGRGYIPGCAPRPTRTVLCSAGKSITPCLLLSSSFFFFCIQPLFYSCLIQ